MMRLATTRRQFLARATLATTGAVIFGGRDESLAVEPRGTTDAGGTIAHSDNVRVYPAPVGEPLSQDFTVTVEGKAAPVYVARVCALTIEERQVVGHWDDPEWGTSMTGFASFDIQGPVEVSVTLPRFELVHSAKIFPSSSGISPAIAGKTITFTIPKPGQYVLESNDNWINSLQIFANPLEVDVPSPHDPNVVYYGPGTHQVESIAVPPGKTLYVAGGAVIYGSFIPPPGRQAGREEPAVVSLQGDNIVVRGRGIIDGSKCPLHTRSILEARGKNIQVEGIVLRDSSRWTLPVRGSDQVKINHLKLFGWRSNSDGIDICGSRSVEVSDCYLRTWDDLVVVKTNIPAEGESRDIVVKRCVLWNEFAHALSLGAELTRNVERVLFSDCDIIRDKGREWALRIYQCDSAHIKDVTFENIRIEECRKLISVWIGKAIWSHDNERGHIDNVVFKNIDVSRSTPIIELKGYDADHAVHGVKFENVTVDGKRLSAGDLKQDQFVDHVTIVP
jgi:Glycosyl hydrolases family 28